MVSTKGSGYPKAFSGRIKWNRSNVIQKGAFGLVFLGDYDDKIARVKRIAEHRVQQERNIDLQVSLKHENIVKLLTVEYDEDFRYCEKYIFP